MIVRRITELAVLALMGDGMLAMSAPTRHSLLYRAFDTRIRDGREQHDGRQPRSICGPEALNR